MVTVAKDDIEATSRRIGARRWRSSLGVGDVDLPRHLTNRLGPIRLHTAPALLALDVLACLLTWAITEATAARFVPQALVTVMVLAALHLYRKRLTLDVLDDLPALLASSVMGFLAVVPLELRRGGQQQVLLESGLWALVLFGLLFAFRFFGFATARRVRCGGGVQDLALIVGAGHVGIQIASNLQHHKEYGIAPVGYIDSHPRIGEGEHLPAPLLGRYEDLAAVIDDFNVLYVMVAFGGVREADLVDILRTCDRMDVDVFIVPRLFELHSTGRDTDSIWGIPMVRVRRAAFRSPWWKVKRLIDIVVSGLALIALAPVLGVCALAVRLEGGPGIIFRQERVGLDGRPFQVLKFRSLKPVDERESQTQWNIAHDDRLGKVGRFLRRSSMDELPQLWNILRGDMSLVGPRPERPHFVEEFGTRIPRYTARHRVPAGLTGWAQVHGLRGNTSIEDRAKFDNYYIENWSPWLDFKIVLKTVQQVVGRQGG